MPSPYDSRPPTTKNAYAEWLGEALCHMDGPVDVIGRDLGALLTMRAVSAFDIPMWSWAADVANIFHPRFEWPPRVHQLQRPGAGERMLERLSARISV